MTATHAPAPPARLVIGLSGYLKSGKDEAGRALVADGFVQFSPADGIREFLYRLDPPIVEDGVVVAPSLAAVVDELGWDEVKVRYPSLRRAQQRCGKEAGRDYLGDDVWVNTVMRDLPAGVDLMNTSVRFPNEADAITARGGYIIRVERPGFEPGEGAHSSETAMDQYPWDFTIINAGTIADLHDAVRKVVATIRAMHAKAATQAAAGADSPA